MVVDSRVQFEGPRLPCIVILRPYYNRVICLAPWQGGQTFVNDKLHTCQRGIEWGFVG